MLKNSENINTSQEHVNDVNEYARGYNDAIEAAAKVCDEEATFQNQQRSRNEFVVLKNAAVEIRALKKNEGEK